ncbi:MAG TPA: hypothetical protein VK541_08415 [Pedobacter sp.]|uniref:hypothetical protein n=1 Tax=Pedobacter sp. TaxID=1411316 RepID=UPI002C4C5987|nr:hypothetical protein [Pedobacter sp.]HMI02489.1 hypothetical protein [Pedobacter sp.]
MELKETFQMITTQEKINDAQKLLLLWIFINSGDDFYCNSSNQELAEILLKHPTNISKAVSALKNQELLVETTIDAKRTLALSDFAKPLIIKNKVNNSYLSFNKNKKITIKDCDEIAIKLNHTFFTWDSHDVRNYLLERTKNHPGLKGNRTPEQLKIILTSIIKGAIKERALVEEIQIDYERSLLIMQNVVKEVCGYTSVAPVEEIDDIALRRERNERNLRKSIKKSYQEKMIDISMNPAQLQEFFTGKKLVSVTGHISRVYEAGYPPFCNIVLDANDSDDIIYATILSNHYENLTAELRGYTGLIKIMGQVAVSGYHHKNIIKSIDELKPIEFLERSSFVNPKLRPK